MKHTIGELVILAKSGDKDAISALYEMTYNGVYQSVRSLLKNEDAAHDITQDSYIKGFENLEKLNDPEKFLPWMKTLAANQARDYLRKKRPVLFSERVNEDGEEIDLLQPDDCIEHLPEAVLDKKETVRLVRDILDTLSEEQRLSIIMYYYEDMGVREIADNLGVSENTIKSRLKYARSKIETEVRKLEKQGTKLYSMAPMPFFTWLLRMAKQQGISFAMDMLETVAATAGTATAAGKATSASAAATGETTAATAGGTASGNVVAGAATKAAGSAAGKTVATKVIAGTLAATMTVGTGAVVNNISKEKANEKAHVVYEEFLDRYQVAFEMDSESFRLDYDRFWSEISDDILEQNPDIDLTVTNDWYMDYTPGEDFEEGISLPDTVYEPNMSGMFLLENKIDGEEIRFAYYDIDCDKIDEMFVAKFYRGELQEHDIAVYTVKNDTLVRGKVHCMFDGQTHTWGFTGSVDMGYVDAGLVYISMGEQSFRELPDIQKPECVWQILFEETQQNETVNETSPTSHNTEPMPTESVEDVAINALAGSYRYEIPLDVLFGRGNGGYNIFHDFNITVTDTDIIIEDIGEPQKSVENRDAFTQKLQDDVDSGRFADTYMLNAEEQQYLTFDSFGMLRINRTSIVFVDEDTIMFDETGFEGTTALDGRINALSFSRYGITLHYFNGPPSSAMRITIGDGELTAYYRDAAFHGFVFYNNSKYPPK